MTVQSSTGPRTPQLEHPLARPKTFDQTRTLDRAMELFWRSGFEATSIADLETHLGLGRQSIYNTFGDKHALYLKTLDRYAAVPVTRMLGRLEAIAPGLDDIHRFFHRLVAYQSQPRPMACFMVAAAMERGGQDREVERKLTVHLRRLHSAFANALQHAQASGDLSQTPVPSTTAHLLTSATLGILVAARGGVPPDTLRRMARAALDSLG